MISRPGFELCNSPASALWVLGWQVCGTSPDCELLFLLLFLVYFETGSFSSPGWPRPHHKVQVGLYLLAVFCFSSLVWGHSCVCHAWLWPVRVKRTLSFLCIPPLLIYLNILIYFVCTWNVGETNRSIIPFWHVYPGKGTQDIKPTQWPLTLVLETGSHTVAPADDSWCKLLWPVLSISTKQSRIVVESDLNTAQSLRVSNVIYGMQPLHLDRHCISLES